MSTVKGFVSHQLYHSPPTRVLPHIHRATISRCPVLSLSLSEERMVITTIAPITLPHRLSPLCINHSRIPRSAPKSPRACCCCRSLSLRSRRICQGHAQAHPVSLGSTASHQSLIIHSINLLFIYSHLCCIKLRVVQATVSSKDGCRQKCRGVVRVVRVVVVVLLSCLFSLTASPYRRHRSGPSAPRGSAPSSASASCSDRQSPSRSPPAHSAGHRQAPQAAARLTKAAGRHLHS